MSKHFTEIQLAAEAHIFGQLLDNYYDGRDERDNDPCPDCGAAVKPGRRNTFACTSEDCDWTFDPVDLVDVD